MKNKPIIFVVIAVLAFLGCKEDVLPKPKAQLRLEYPEVERKKLETDKFEFEYNTIAGIKDRRETSLTLDYPSMRGSIFLTYKGVDGNLDKLLTDAQKLSYEHVVKADGIEGDSFVDEENKVFGMIYEITGNAASQSQFYVTDSIKHFVTGSLYFYAKPNYDSIYPAAEYLQKDIRKIMETLRWK
ncbi:gliding motility lipoprotein GldD [uncultured Kriegella sp.]|uniref:gliding motility lipoprotein GldD n=1 Tax=uncultured Kriegella sp. TaxID=1798910 RepID=UPI0030DD5298|tara:strand:+ start:340951 stop:341505 length:555 start_codon:yes stop_codon:yes gene_type:complete